MDMIYTDSDLCYRALCSRDARFDGRIFVAVTTTGIYCRPICPAPTPYAHHVRFYPCAAAAEAAGFRACRRCHPEASPGSPEWNVRADLVARALRLIADGVIDSEGVSGLASRLAVSERHLHRELVAEVGVGPLALARTRRAQTARLLIDQTDLSLTTIAFTAGFASIRQFNETMQASFGCPPSAFRRRALTDERGSEGKLTLRLQYRPPLDIDTLLTYLAKRAIPGVEEVVGRCYRRTIVLPHSQGVIELEPTEKTHAIQLRLQLSDLSDLSMLVQRCRQFFDLDAVPAAIADVLGSDPLLAPLVSARPGLRIPGAVDGFELAVRAILGQQVSVAGARTLAGRIVKTLGVPLGRSGDGIVGAGLAPAPTIPLPDQQERAQGTLSHYFPAPQAMAQADLLGLGVTKARIVALRALAHAVAQGELALDRNADREQTITCLLQLPGVGPWTASYIAMRALGDPDAFPLADLGLKRAFEQQGVAADLRSIERRAEAWRPWRAYATHHLWASLAETPLRQRSPSTHTRSHSLKHQQADSAVVV